MHIYAVGFFLDEYWKRMKTGMKKEKNKKKTKTN